MLARPRPNILTLFWRFVRCEKRHCLVVALVGLFALSGFALRVLEPGPALVERRDDDRYGLRRRASTIFLGHTEMMTDLEGKLGDQLALASPREV